MLPAVNLDCPHYPTFRKRKPQKGRAMNRNTLIKAAYRICGGLGLVLLVLVYAPLYLYPLVPGALDWVQEHPVQAADTVVFALAVWILWRLFRIIPGRRVTRHQHSKTRSLAGTVSRLQALHQQQRYRGIAGAKGYSGNFLAWADRHQVVPPWVDDQEKAQRLAQAYPRWQRATSVQWEQLTRHEAAHALMAHALGQRVGYIDTTPGVQGADSGAWTHWEGSSATERRMDFREILRASIEIGLAGGIQDALDDANPSGSESDLRDAMRDLASLSFYLPGRTQTQLMDECVAHVREVLAAHQAAVGAVASRLSPGSRLDGATIHEVLDQQGVPRTPLS